MRSALPALPLAMIILALGLFGLAGWCLIVPLTLNENAVQLVPAAQSDEMLDNLVQPATYPTADQSTAKLLGGSPFVFDRAAYSRHTPRPPEPPQPTYRPELVGLIGRGESRAALIVWNPGQHAERFSLGDETPWGKVVELGETSVEFEQEDTRHHLGLFD